MYKREKLRRRRRAVGLGVGAAEALATLQLLQARELGGDGVDAAL